MPINKDDPDDKDHLVNVLTRLSHDPGFDYLSDIIQRDDVDFTAIRLAQEEWDYKKEGLSPAGAALLAIALSMATGWWRCVCAKLDGRICHSRFCDSSDGKCCLHLLSHPSRYYPSQ
ncbi:hypothetical protein [Moraxella bovoculi]|uniref:hypothetical protein n=1 Tax=Moraxella bovoculi TaxID=386891 RepID=UPI001313EADD|nr:hypothetical protein [Moraxella bovoculi]